MLPLDNIFMTQKKDHVELFTVSIEIRITVLYPSPIVGIVMLRRMLLFICLKQTLFHCVKLVMLHNKIQLMDAVHEKLNVLAEWCSSTV